MLTFIEEAAQFTLVELLNYRAEWWTIDYEQIADEDLTRAINVRQVELDNARKSYKLPINLIEHPKFQGNWDEARDLHSWIDLLLAAALEN